MGLELEIGILADLRENDLEGYEYYRKQFDLLNRHLSQMGLPNHEEPEKCEIWCCQMYGYSGLHYLRRLAAHLSYTGNLPSPGKDDSYKDAVLDSYYRNTGDRNSGHLARILRPSQKRYDSFDHLILHSDSDGFYLPLQFEEVLCPDPELGIIGGEIGSTTQLLRECERLASVLEIPSHFNETSDELLDAAGTQGEGSAIWRKYGVESFTCVCLIEACWKSIDVRAAIVFT